MKLANQKWIAPSLLVLTLVLSTYRDALAFASCNDIKKGIRNAERHGLYDAAQTMRDNMAYTCSGQLDRDLRRIYGKRSRHVPDKQPKLVSCDGPWATNGAKLSDYVRQYGAPSKVAIAPNLGIGSESMEAIGLARDDHLHFIAVPKDPTVHCIFFAVSDSKKEKRIWVMDAAGRLAGTARIHHGLRYIVQNSTYGSEFSAIAELFLGDVERKRREIADVVPVMPQSISAGTTSGPAQANEPHTAQLASAPAVSSPEAPPTVLSNAEIEGLRKKIQNAWQPPMGADTEQLRFVVRMKLAPNGTLSEPPSFNVVDGPASAVPHLEVLKTSILRAVFQAQPYDMLPSTKYESWKDIEVSFDLRDLISK